MKTTRSLAAVAALALALPLAACSSDSTKDAGSTSSATATAEASTAATAEASPSASMPAAPTDGQEVTASATGVTFNVPDGWIVIADTSAIDDATASAMAAGAGEDVATFKQRLAALDMFAASSTPTTLPNGSAFADNILVSRQTSPAPLTEADAPQVVTQLGGDASTANFKTAATANGEAGIVYYDGGAQGTTFHAAAIAAPTSDGSYAVINVTAVETSTVEDLVTRVTSSVK